MRQSRLCSVQIEEICKVHDIEIKEPEKGRGYSLTPNEYKAQIEAEGMRVKSVRLLCG